MNRDGYEFIIVGDSPKYEECLIALAGYTEERANAILERMVNDPNDNDIALIKDCKNLRIKQVKSADQWWNDPFLVN